MTTAGLPPTLVLGLGNPVLGDDGIGCRVAQALGGAAEDLEAEIDTCEKGGLSLMERMLGYRRVILIDALTTGEGPRGRVTTIFSPASGCSAIQGSKNFTRALGQQGIGNLLAQRFGIGGITG